MQKELIKKIKIKANKPLKMATRLKERILGGGFDFSSLEAVQIETTISCNLHCAVCNDEMKKRTNEKFLSLQGFKNIINQFPVLREVNFTGYGEPLLNENIFEMIRYAKSRGVESTQFATNSTLLTERKSREIIESGLNQIIFSVDSADADTYKAIRIGADFEKVLQNIKNFVKIRAELKSDIKMHIYSVGIFSCLGGLKKIIDLAESLGIENVSIRGFVDHTGRKREYNKEALYYPENADVAGKYLKEASGYAASKGISLKYPPVRPSKFQCLMPSQRPFISVEGFVTPCCVQGMDPRNVNFGNVSSEKFSKIWNNKKYRDFRKQLLTDAPPSLCVFCPRLKGMG